MRCSVVVSCLFAACASLPLLPAQNSTKKLRSAPGELAQRAGNAVPWRASVEAALAEAKQTGKPVFWYVPTVAGSPMDRKAEVDRYLRGGPFSWPTTVQLLAQHTVPVAEVPRGELQRRYGLLRGQFIEPGYLLLAGDGSVLAQVAQLTTLHPEWFEAPLRRRFQAPAEGFPGNPALREAWDAYRAGERAAAVAACDAVLAKAPAAEVAAEAHWLAGAAMCRDGRRRDAIGRWQQLTEAWPEQPLAWKAALELEGHGPFGRGFEDYLPLPAAQLAAAPFDGSRAAPGYTEDQLWQRSVAFLLTLDDGDGCLRDSTYDFGGTDSLPNVHAAVTCLAGEALLAAAARLQRAGQSLPGDGGTRLEAMLQRILANVQDDVWLELADRDEILWARAYAVRFLGAFRRLRPQQGEQVLPALQRSTAALLALQPDTGVWFHEYGNAFAIATALQALHAARGSGVEVAQDRIDRGLRALAGNRTAAGAFAYSQPRGAAKASVEAAAGRMPLCELALFLFGGSDAERLLTACEAGHRHHGLLAAVRKYDNHADQHGYGGFFFWFDLLARIEAILALPASPRRSELLAQQRELVLALPEFDGCFVDSHELGRGYGTAMALLCLQQCSTP
jgi:tetratricopeptide (TPR) repeat protein